MEFKIPEKQVYKIGEVCEMLQLEPTVLRYWETEFEDLQPQKNAMGQRVYRQEDIEVAYQIRKLLYEEGYTIAGARKQLKKQLTEARSPGGVFNREQVLESVRKVRAELQRILRMLATEVK